MNSPVPDGGGAASAPAAAAPTEPSSPTAPTDAIPPKATHRQTSGTVPTDNRMTRGLQLARRRWTLRRRLVVSIVALVALLSAGIGAVSIYGLNQYLEQRLDLQLSEAADRVQGGGAGMPGMGDQPEMYLSRGLPLGTIAVAVDNGVVTNALTQGPAGSPVQLLTDEESDVLAEASLTDGSTTIELGDSRGDYRALVFDTARGSSIILAVPLSEVEGTVAQFRMVILLISALGVLVAALASFFIVSLALRPLRRVAATATQVASLPLDRGEVSLAVRVPDEDTDPRTEVGQVGAAFNGMLGHVDAALRARQASENKVRQFVADASHELRTPLASIRGYAELTRRGGHRLPDDVSHSMARVESEAVRMTSLVEDLLLLARLDEGRELEKHPVDLGMLLVDCISDAYAAGPEHEWEFDAPDQRVVIMGDQPRIHQVIANLLANARVHTPEGSRVAVTLAVEADTAVITVDDNGPGISPELQPTLFERFARGDSSRSRIAGSTGLGLSIVQAVVQAHGGAVSVASAPGATSFRIELPHVVAGSGASAIALPVAD